MIIDTHVHVVSRDRDRFPLAPVDLPNGAWYLDRPVDVAGLSVVMDRHGVDAAVLVQARGAYGYDNSYVIDAASSSRRFTAVGVADPTEDTSCDELGASGCSGARLFDIPPGTHADLSSAFAACERLGLIAVPTMLAPSIPALAAAARRHRGVVVAVDHCAFVDFDVAAERRSLAEHLAPLDQVTLKVTSHVLLHTQDPAEVVEWLGSTFGPRRLVWGSDYPQTPDATYRELVELAERASTGLADADRAAFLGDNAARLWPELAPA